MVPDVRAFARLVEPLLQRMHVGMFVDEALGLAETNAVDDARVVERVSDDDVIRRQDALEESAVRIEARRVQEGIVQIVERGDLPLERLVQILGAADEAH